MRKLKLKTKYLLLFLLPGLLFACEREESVTKIYGRVIDIDHNLPVPGVQVDLVIGDQIGNSFYITNPNSATTTTNNKGEYSFSLPYKESQQLFLVTPIIKSYVQVIDGYSDLPYLLNSSRKNQHDIKIAKGSYLKLNIKKTSPPYPIEKMEVSIRTVQNALYSPLNGQRLLTEKIHFEDKKIDTTIIRGYFYKQVNSASIMWSTKTNAVNDTVKTLIKEMPLAEYDTVSLRITY